MVLQYARLEGRSGHEAGRQLLAQMYKDLTGEEMPFIATEERGKPYFPGSPVHFSISHTKRHVFCVLSDKPVGIDAEEIDRRIDLRLADKILSPAEKMRYEKAPDKQAALLKLWVLKEADGKRTGQGINGYPIHTDFDPDDPRIHQIAHCYVAIIEEPEKQHI